MKKKGVNVWGLIVVLMVVVSLFSGAVSAENVSEDLTKSVADPKIRGVGTSSSSDLPVIGKGVWIWKIWEIENGDVSKIIQKLQSANVDWVTIKCGDSNSYYPDHGYMYNWLNANGYSNFGEVVTQFHNAGIKVFGWQYVYSESKYSGTGYSTEAAVSNKILDISGIDGLIIDAEEEYEGEGKGPIAENYMADIRNKHPSSFIAYSPFPIIDYHLWFPYIEFGRYCDAVMPQAYWKDIGVTPTEMVNWMNEQWDKWHETWKSGGYGDSVKPLIPVGQGDVSGSEITEFCEPVLSRYEGVSLWRYGTMTGGAWTAYAAVGGDTAPPTVDAFSVTSDSVTLGNSFTIPYTVSDTGGSGLKQVELWRAIDVGGEPDWGDFPVDNPKQITPLSGQTSYSSSFSDAPPSVGIYWYGMHVLDNAENVGLEPDPPGPIEVEVTSSCDGTDTSCGIYPNCENCNVNDGCYAYSNGCEIRDYYCYSNELGCLYTYSNRHTDYYDSYVYYCSGDTVRKHRLYHDFYCDGGSCIDHPSWVDDQLVENCNDYDGWYCNGDVSEYRDYYCSGSSCTYTVTSSENCNNNDGCYVYGDGCEIRDYYCSGGSCTYTYSDRHMDSYDNWVYYCSGDTVRKHQLFHDFYCDGGSCTDHTSWVNDQLVENCNAYDGWADTGNTQWVDDPANECKEKEQKEQEYHDYTCSGGSCTYSITNTQWIDTGATRNKQDGTICGSDYYDDYVYYCSGDTVRKHRLYHDFYCDGGSCVDHPSWANDQLVENCNDYDGWADTGNTQWVDDPANECKEKEQKEQEYHDYTCSGGSCTYSVTNTQWLDTGVTRNKPDGTVCGYGEWEDDPANPCKERRETLKCVAGTCSPSGEYEYQNKPDGTICGYGEWEDDPANPCKERREILKCTSGTCSPSGEYDYQDKPDGTICGYGGWEDDPANPCKERRETLKCVAGTCSPSGEYDYQDKPDGTICGYGDWEEDPANPCKERREILKCVSGTCSPSGEYDYQDKPDGTICGYGEWEDDPSNTCRERRAIYKCSGGSCVDSGTYDYQDKPDGTICGYGEWEDDPANPCKERREILKCLGLARK